LITELYPEKSGSKVQEMPVDKHLCVFSNISKVSAFLYLFLCQWNKACCFLYYQVWGTVYRFRSELSGIWNYHRQPLHSV